MISKVAWPYKDLFSLQNKILSPTILIVLIQYWEKGLKKEKGGRGEFIMLGKIIHPNNNKDTQIHTLSLLW